MHKQHAHLSGALNMAVKWGLIGRNPAAQASAPTAKRVRVRPPKVDVVGAMMSAAEKTNPVLATAVAIAAVTGGRGELVALRWSHVDWADRTLSFEESVTFQGKTMTTGSTKTHQWRKLASTRPSKPSCAVGA